MSVELKNCTLCKIDLDLSNFYYCNTKQKYLARCKSCLSSIHSKAHKKRYIPIPSHLHGKKKKYTQNRTEKVCYDCKELKPLKEYNKNKTIADGHATECKLCKKQRDLTYREKNYESFKDKRKQYKKKAKENNPDKIRLLGRKYANDRRVKKIQQGLDNSKFKNELKDIYLNCPSGYEVDHIIPLINSKVCGLHVPWNLQYLTKEQNRRKHNKVLQCQPME